MASPPKKTRQLISASWEEKAEEALNSLPPHERTLLLRIIEANGQRVSISELSKTMGLPPAPSLDQDFAGLKGFIAKEKEKNYLLTMPVISAGSDDKGWYWMSADDAADFEKALPRPVD
jgi:hypothetical protein